MGFRTRNKSEIEKSREHRCRQFTPQRNREPYSATDSANLLGVRTGLNKRCYLLQIYKTPNTRTHTHTKLYEFLIIKNETLELEIDEIEIEDRKSSSSSSSRSYSEKWMGRRW